jgi:prophage regulatory protein
MITTSEDAPKLRVRRPMSKLDAVIKTVHLSGSSIYRLMALGKFPLPVKLSDEASAWVDDEIDQWMEDRIRERDQMTPEERQRKVMKYKDRRAGRKASAG